MNRLLSIAVAVAGLALAVFLAMRTSAQELVGEDALAGAGDHWIFEDIEAGYAKAQETGKPLLVAFR